jgi:hypothetical protein
MPESSGAPRDLRGADGAGGLVLSAATRHVVALFVDRRTRQWVVRDPTGDLWRLPSVDDSWDQREVFELTDDADLECVPGHYRYMLNLPF